MEKIHAGFTVRKAKMVWLLKKTMRITQMAGQMALMIGSFVLIALMLSAVLLTGGINTKFEIQASNAVIMDRYDMYVTNRTSEALEGVLNIEKVYWLNDEDLIAPEPDQTKFGSTTDPASLQWLIDEAAELLDGQELLFSTDISIMPGTDIQYYLDETILSITWKQSIGNACYNFNEVKIAHPSQFRRFLADGQYGSERQYYTTQMLGVVNAVSASNGDFYKYRPYGIVVYNGEVFRAENTPDTCFIDDQGEMILVQDRTFADKADVEKFVADNNIRFSLSFGPILVENYQLAVPRIYEFGEILGGFSRAALADMGDLHYLIVVNSFEGGQDFMPTLRTFAEVVHSFGCEKAYALDGGQTAIIVMNDQMVSIPSYGNQRMVSDIIYFATAVPNGQQ